MLTHVLHLNNNKLSDLGGELHTCIPVQWSVLSKAAGWANHRCGQNNPSLNTSGYPPGSPPAKQEPLLPPPPFGFVLVIWHAPSPCLQYALQTCNISMIYGYADQSPITDQDSGASDLSPWQQGNRIVT